MGLMAGTLGDCKLFQLGGGGGEAGSEAERIGKGRSGDLVNHGRGRNIISRSLRVIKRTSEKGRGC